MDTREFWDRIKSYHRKWIFECVLLVLVFFIFVWGYSEAIQGELFFLFVMKDYAVFLLCFYFLPNRLIKSQSSIVKLGSIVAFWFFLFYLVWCLFTYGTCWIFREFATSYNPNFDKFLSVILEGIPLKTLLDFVRFGPDYMGIFILAIGPQWIRLAIEDHISNYRLQKENLSLELDFLKSQINPHFLFNTLNNIYLLLEFDPVKGKEMILRLTGLMRYNIFESKNKTIQLYKELIYIDDFLSLMRIRYGKQVKIRSNIGKVSEEFQIIPLLMISFIENAFKHGPDADPDNNFIAVDIHMTDYVLKVHIVNKIQVTDKHVSNGSKKGIYGGIGIENVKRRLALHYPDRYKLDLGIRNSFFNVEMRVKLR